MDFPHKRRSPPEEKQAQIAAVRKAYWEGMAEDGPEVAAMLGAIDRSFLLDEPARYDHVKALINLLPQATLGAAVSFGLDDKNTLASVEMFIAAYGTELRAAFRDC